jgi:hypothetical protein
MAGGAGKALKDGGGSFRRDHLAAKRVADHFRDRFWAELLRGGEAMVGAAGLRRRDPSPYRLGRAFFLFSPLCRGLTP